LVILCRFHITQDDTAALLYSSGATGTSRGVAITHGNFIASLCMISCLIRFFYLSCPCSIGTLHTVHTLWWNDAGGAASVQVRQHAHCHPNILGYPCAFGAPHHDFTRKVGPTIQVSLELPWRRKLWIHVLPGFQTSSFNRCVELFHC
jgi:acyl-CoA synthetase (AMP-forming)/AMP-acid ligase II